MDDLKDRSAAEPPSTEAAPPARKRRTWLRVLLYVLAAIGLLFVALLAFMFYQSRTSEPGVEIAQHTSFNEVEMVETVMTDAYGKYSDDKRGWLYVHNDDQTYVMRVIHQVHMDDTPGGDHLYFLASGTPISGSGTRVYGAFHVYPDPDKPGELRQSSMRNWDYAEPLKPEDVRFLKLSKTQWAWILKSRKGDGKEDTARETTTILASHDWQIVQLAEFTTSARYKPGTDCAELERAYATYAGTDTEGDEEPEEPLRCQDRRWAYKIGNTNANVPAPITITVSGTEDEKPIDEKTWKVVFDSKAYSYTMPADLDYFQREAEGAKAEAPVETLKEKDEEASSVQ